MKKAALKKMDPILSEGYRNVARSLLKTASDLHALGDRAYGTAIGILCIHAAIAYADAICIKLGGRKSTDRDHNRVADLVNEIVGEKQNQKQITTLRKILSIKNEVEYGGEFYQIEGAAKTLKQTQQLAEWAERILLRI